MQHAIIDLGSNTIRLCIYDIISHDPVRFRLIHNKKTMASLASYLDDQGNLVSEGIARAISTIQSYQRKIARAPHACTTHLFATAVLRNARNRDVVIEKIEAQTGLHVDLITGTEEATLGFIGSMHCLHLDEALQIDMGGASTELVQFKNRSITHVHSLGIGSLALYLQYVTDIMPTPREIDEIQRRMRDELAAVNFLDGYQTLHLTGVGGSVRAAHKLKRPFIALGDELGILAEKPEGISVEELFDDELDNAPNTESVTRHEIELILKAVRYDHRSAMKQILRVIPERIHTAAPGIAAVAALMDTVGAKELTISKYGVREGYLINRVLASSRKGVL